MMIALRGGFRKDVLLLLVVTILVGSALSAGIAYATDDYFGQAITGLLGDYGEYDFIISVRKDLEKPAQDVVNDLVGKRFPGGRVKKGVTVAGKANFLVSIPRNMRRRDVLEGLGGLLSTVPGYSGYTVIMEPRITVRGMQPGTARFFMARFMELPGVVFAFQNETGCDVIVNSESNLRKVEKLIARSLAEYKVVEGRFPIGARVDDISAVGGDVAATIKRDMGTDTALDISLGDTNKDMQRFVRTLGEMRRFLLSYATEVKVRVDDSAGLIAGDSVILALPTNAPREGERLAGGAVVARVLEVGSSVVTAVIVQGDSSVFLGPAGSGFRGTVRANRLMLPVVADSTQDDALSGSIVGPFVGPATVWAQRRELVSTIAESIKLLVQLERASLEADKTLADLESTLARYETTLGGVSGVRDALVASSGAIDSSITKLEELRKGDFRETINRSAQLVDLLSAELAKAKAARAYLAKSYQDLRTSRSQVDKEMAAVKVEQPQLYSKLASIRQGLAAQEEAARQRLDEADRLAQSSAPIAVELSAWRQTVPSLLLDFARLDSVLSQRVGVRTALEQVLTSVTQAVSSLESIDIGAIRTDVQVAGVRLQAVKAVDVTQIVKQLEYVQASLPSLRDEDIGRSLNLIDRYLQGQVIPGERILVLTEKSVPDSFVGKAIQERTGMASISLLSTSAGVVQPDIRGEVARLLKEVRSTIAALVALIFATTVLATDHATLISAVKSIARYRASAKQRKPIWRWLSSPTLYGVAVGGAISSSIALLSGAKLPYVGAWAIGALGALAGWVVSRLSERLSPVNASEILGAESLGMPMCQVLRQVVIPAGRPGLMAILNKRRVVLR